MSNEFYLPITLNLAPPKWMVAAIVGMHCAPLPLLALAVDGAFAWPLGAIVGFSLIFYLRRQRLATAAIRLEANAAGEWRLYRNTGRCDEVELVDQINLGWCVLLLMKRNRRRFRLVVKCGEQPREQLHRLRVLRVSRRAGRPTDPFNSGR